MTITKNTTRLGSLLALLVIAVLGGLQVYYFDITFHGPDQIRDMEVARKLLHEHEWPKNSPPMFGERITLPPGFYYLLVLPLLLKDSDASVFITFGILLALSAIYLWRQASQAFGQRCGLIYTILAFPLFPSIYAHSAWGPALIITGSNILLGLYIKYAANKITGWLALPLVFFLLVQIHPSAAPLLLGLTLYALSNHRIVLEKKTILSIVIILLATAIWLINADVLTKLKTGGFTSISPQSSRDWLNNLLNLEKWRDAFLMPYNLVVGVRPAMEALDTLAGIHLAVILAGLVFCLIFASRNNIIRWILAITAIWFIVSMAFLNQGGFWHLDVIHPWLAVASAYGLSQLSKISKIPDLGFHTLAAALFAIVFSSHMILYDGMNRVGKIDWMVSSLFFPRSQPTEDKIPSYSYRHLDAFRQTLANRGICQDQITGLESMAMREATDRYFEPQCPYVDAPEKTSPRYFVAPIQDSRLFDFTKNMKAIAMVGESSIYAPEQVEMMINGEHTNNVLTHQKINYMTYRPARLEQGLRIAIKQNAPNVILRLALRCSEDYPVQRQEYWNLQGASNTKSMISVRHRYLGLSYYDLEWTFVPENNAPILELASHPMPMNCDVSAIARSAAP